MEEQKQAILEFIALQKNWRARYADLKRRFVDAPREFGQVRMNHVQMISQLRELVRDRALLSEPITTRGEGGRVMREYALPTENMTMIRAWEWAPECVIARLSGLDRQLSREEHKLFWLAWGERAERSSRPRVLDYVNKSMPSVPLEVWYRRLLDSTHDPTTLEVIRDEIYHDERLREDQAQVLGENARVLIRRGRR